MQTKISKFFQMTTNNARGFFPPLDQVEDMDISGSPEPDVLVTYRRRELNNPSLKSDGFQICTSDEYDKGIHKGASGMSSRRPDPLPNVTNKKRSYSQYHLELGQSDFLLHSCDVCGLSYALGDEGDEKAHKVFHKNYYQGIFFKGWNNERIVPMPKSETIEERIIVVLDGDPPGQKHKLQEVARVMSNDLCLANEWSLHKLCKTYLFISRKRIVGCLVLEPIRTAHRIISKSSSSDSSRSTKLAPESSNANSRKTAKSVLQFGNVTFRRETIKSSSRTAEQNMWDSGATFYEEEAVPAVCGVRVIWVAPSQRRKRVATRVLDAARKNFIANKKLAPSDCAFSAPTSAGRAFAAVYSRTESFLVYKSDD